MDYDLLGASVRAPTPREHIGSRAQTAVIRRHQDCEPYWGTRGGDLDLDSDFDERPLHPAILSPNQLQTCIRVFVVALLITVAAMFLGGCSVHEHRDGGGYTVRYASVSDTSAEPARRPPPPRKIVAKQSAAAPPSVIVVERDRERERGDSHPVLNIGKDDEIPREYRHYVSDRSVRGLRSRMSMCKDARPGYCSAPNVPHCHGPFCHAHPGGDKRHTH